MAAGGGAVFGGCVCADDWGTAAIITESAITIAEYLVRPLLGRHPVSRLQYLLYMHPGGGTAYVHYDALPVV